MQASPLRLVDDLIEPFRPLVDLTVHNLALKGVEDVNQDAKRALVHALYHDMPTETGITPATVCMQRLATSLAQIYLGERKHLDMPLTDSTPALPAAEKGI